MEIRTAQADGEGILISAYAQSRIGGPFQHAFLRATDKIVQQVNGGSEAVEPKPESRGIPLAIVRYWGG
ncbi:hypothetical protein [Synechococcus sp. R3-13]|uniref:hypothetical protein n=1 Tax=Synechococcus sp. R3-13 TaxID=2421316 RepID=UPI0039C36186